MNLRRNLCLAFIASLASASVAQTEAPTTVTQLDRVTVRGVSLPSVKEFFDNPQYGTVSLSANSEHLMVTTPVNGRLNLAVIELKTRKGVALTNFRDFDVLNARWVGNERIVYALGNLNSPTGPDFADGGGFFMVSRDGSDSRKLSPTFKELRDTGSTVNRGFTYLRSVPKSDEEVIATARQRSADSLDVYRLNVKTGRSTLLSQTRPPRVSRFLVDSTLEPRVAVSDVEKTTQQAIFHRRDANSPWEEIARFDETRGPVFMPVGFMGDKDETLIVASNAGRDTMALHRYDPVAKKMGEKLAEHPRFDLGANQLGETVPGLIVENDKLVGVKAEADKATVTWLDPDYERLQRMIDAALPGSVNEFTRTADGSRVIVTSYSDREPARWFMLDEKNKTLEDLVSSVPWIKKENLVEQRYFVLKTRDGLEIPSYYFLPHGYKPGQKLPTIVHIHGGPHVRSDLWGYRRGFGTLTGQFFASRGYAVIVPNFRITPGLGSKVFYSGFGGVGSSTIDDHEDAVKWGISQGFVDPARVCIEGGSYGGYATLMSLARHPATYRCGVAAFPVSDMEMQLTSASTDFGGSEEAIQFWRRLIGGDSTKSASELTRSVSPAHMAASIKQPVFLIAGASDRRTPIEQTRAMQSALERAGNRPRVLIKADEGHGYGNVENRVEQYSEMLKFFEQHIGTSAK